MSQLHTTSTRLRSHVLLLIVSTVISVFRCDLANATEYYVSGNGRDKNDGLSTSTAFRTIQKAADLTQSGDTVFVMNGLYTNSSLTGDVVTITHSGSPSAWITYKAYPDNSPHLKFNGWSGFNVSAASYIEVNGFRIEGNNDNVMLDYALSQENNLSNASTTGNGIAAFGDVPTHHIKVVNNRIYKCGGEGISFVHSDYITVDHNQIYNNSWYSPYGTSGISLYQNVNTDNNTGYKMFITNNISSGNYNYIPFYYMGKITDGQGIIIDDSKNSQFSSPFGAYSGRTLIANNIAYNNGGAGIHIYFSEHVDVVNNTAYMNSQSSELNYGQIDAISSNDVNILNNILYPIAGKKVNDASDSSNVIYDYNIYFNSKDISVLGPNDLKMNPQFVNPSTDPAIADFHLQSTSPAINSGTSSLAPDTDIEGNSRSAHGGFDRGSYQSNKSKN